jgi:hypothetical protein
VQVEVLFTVVPALWLEAVAVFHFGVQTAEVVTQVEQGFGLLAAVVGLVEMAAMQQQHLLIHQVLVAVL